MSINIINIELNVYLKIGYSLVQKCLELLFSAKIHTAETVFCQEAQLVSSLVTSAVEHRKIPNGGNRSESRIGRQSDAKRIRGYTISTKIIMLPLKSV